MLNLKNRTIYCRDNIDVLRGINSHSIDLVYLDPPFNKKKTFTAPIGSSAEGAEFSDIFREEDIKDEWVNDIKNENHQLHSLLMGIKTFSNSYNYCYCVYMAIRLLEIWRVMKPTASVYLHCDSTMSHYLKLVLDNIFGEDNFRNEIVWRYDIGGRGKKDFGKKHDIILRYTKTNNYVFNSDDVLVPFESKMTEWSYTKGKMAGKKMPEGKVSSDVWDIPAINAMAKERTGYPTQKPLALLERIIKASSQKGDMVLDPFCGCATTCIAAEKLERNWAGVDVSQKAYELVKIRLEKEVPSDFFRGEPHFTTTPPERTDKGASGEVHGYIYIISHPKYKGHLKVGIAKDPKARLNAYQTSDPNRSYKLEKTYQTQYNAEIEKQVHEYYHAPEEWVSTDDVNEVFNLIKKYDKMLKS